MQRVVLIIVLLLAAGCGNFRRQWPAVVRGVEDFKSAEQEKVLQALKEINETGENPILGDDPLVGYPILIRKVAYNKAHPTRVGYAIVGPTSCTIELSEKLFAELKALLTTVVFHELGHCAGLGHTSDSHQVMSENATPFEDFTSNELGVFFDSLFQAIGFAGV